MIVILLYYKEKEETKKVTFDLIRDSLLLGFSLFNILNRTQTKMGEQLLKQYKQYSIFTLRWMLLPLYDKKEIESRHHVFVVVVVLFC